MTLSEFKAWFSGFTESMDSTPNEKQWKRIKARVAEINDVPTTYPVFIDRYRPYWREPSMPFVPYWTATSTNGSSLSSEGTIGLNENNQFFNASAAMLDLGKAEYLVVNPLLIWLSLAAVLCAAAIAYLYGGAMLSTHGMG